MNCKRIVVWGIGKRSRIVLDSLQFDKCMLVSCIDRMKKEPVVIDDKVYSVGAIESIRELLFDYVIVTTADVTDIKKQLQMFDIEDEKIIYFWDEDISKYSFLSIYPKEYYLAQSKIKEYELVIKNAPYEYGEYRGPIIRPAEELLEKIITEKKSLCRFGDGEFEVILGRNRSRFQKTNESFANKLEKVLHNKSANPIVAIADNYGSLEKYTEEAAMAIRYYLTEDVRRQHMELIDLDKVYYDAYVSRSYLMYKDKCYSDKIFELYRKLFDKRDILIVEGHYTRSGYGNDLFSTAKSIKRILCPDSNCYDVYSEIYDAIVSIAEKNDLILLTLGSTATILAYDLTCLGYQTIDLGQLDNEYEWRLRKSTTKEAIPGKTVSDMGSDRHLDTIEIDDEYYSQIVREIKSC